MSPHTRSREKLRLRQRCRRWRPGGPGGERAQQVQVSRAGGRRAEQRSRRAARVGPASVALGTLAALGGKDRPGRWRRVLAAWHPGCARFLAEEPLGRRETELEPMTAARWIRGAAAAASTAASAAPRRSPPVRRRRCHAPRSELHPEERATGGVSRPVRSSCACGRPHPFAAAARLACRARRRRDQPSSVGSW